MTQILDKKGFSTLVRLQVISVMQELINDPDKGLDFTKDAKMRLHKSLKSKRAGRVISAADVFKQYGLKSAL